MSTAPITSSSDVASSMFGGTDTSTLPKQTLGQDDFLRLLITQMSSQDPLNPMSNQDFIAQMAQFSTLEQTRNMQSDLSDLRNQQAVLQANGMIGKDVDLQVGDSVVHGTVSAVEIADGTPKVVVNGISYDLSEVIKIAPPAPQT